MRDLRVIGLEPDGQYVICTDPKTGDKFRLPADDKLRAASRGDIARLGQIEIEMDSLLRPKEIQARIRAGATVEQVAADSGMALSRVEVFAHPVLLERSQAASMAQAGHPLRSDGPAVQTLAEVVALAFRGRGHHLDDAASELVDPDFGRQLRGLAPVRALEVAPGDSASGQEDSQQQSFDEYYGTTADSEIDGELESHSSESPSNESPSNESPSAESARSEPRHESAPAPKRDKKGKPAMPSWEDVLLGVRSSGHS